MTTNNYEHNKTLTNILDHIDFWDECVLVQTIWQSLVQVHTLKPISISTSDGTFLKILFNARGGTFQKYLVHIYYCRLKTFFFHLCTSLECVKLNHITNLQRSLRKI